jgi:hypothetical protein
MGLPWLRPSPNIFSLMLSTADGILHVSTQFLITPLDPACDAILGLNWLTENNPRFDWALCSIEWESEPNPETAQLHAILTPESKEDLLLIGEEDNDICPDPIVPQHYHDFSDVFDKKAAVCLPPHQSFDLSIKEFLQDHLATNTIHPSQSSIGAPVLFVKKKDGSLQIVVELPQIKSNYAERPIPPTPHQ